MSTDKTPCGSVVAPVSGPPPVSHVGHKPSSPFYTFGTPPGERRAFTDEMACVSKHTLRWTYPDIHTEFSLFNQTPVFWCYTEGQ